MNRMRFFITALVITLALQVQAKKPRVERIDPPAWWTGMKNPDLQLMVYGKNIAETTPEITYNG
ncbi:MAG: hypothetical protein DRJ02_10200, partial [Bacteroidetes bacterium]